MSTEDDRLVLTAYLDWQALRTETDTDLSVARFLQEREHGFNASRIANALTILNDRISRNENRDDVLDHHDAMAFLGNLVRVRDILEGDRPFIEQSTLTGPTTRTYL